MSDKQLTKRQSDVYEFIRESISSNGYSPTYRDIADRFDISSPNGVACHIAVSKKKGVIRTSPRIARSIQLVGLSAEGKTLESIRNIVKKESICVAEDKLEAIRDLLG